MTTTITTFLRSLMRPILRAIAQTLLDSLDAPPQSRRTNILVGDEPLRAIALNKFVTQSQGTVTVDVPWSALDAPATFPPSAHAHVKADVSDFPATMPPDAHTHVKADVTDFPATLPGRIAIITYVGNGEWARTMAFEGGFVPVCVMGSTVGMPAIIHGSNDAYNFVTNAVTISANYNISGYTFRMLVLG